MIRFTCPKCGIALRTRSGTDGHWVRCQCGEKILVPGGQFQQLELHVKDNSAASSTSLPDSLDFDEVDLELGIDHICRKRERSRELAIEQMRDVPHPMGFFSLILSLFGGFMLFLAAMALSFFASGFLIPAIMLCLAGVFAGTHAQLATKGPDYCARAGVWIGCVLLAAAALAFFASTDQWEEIADALRRHK